MRLVALLDKELREVISNRLLVSTIAVPPLLFAILTIGMAYAARVDPLSARELEALYRIDPSTRALDAISATQILLVGQVIVLFLSIPAMVPLVIASFSIIGEKHARSLEPLLATPIRIWELLLGKCLAAVLPAVAVTWGGYVLALIGVYIVGNSIALRSAASPVMLLSLLTVAPLLSATAVGLAVIVSSRVNDTRVAQQASAVLILPVVGLFVGQAAGKILISIPLILFVALGLLVLDAVLLWIAVRLFRRETILTDWR